MARSTLLLLTRGWTQYLISAAELITDSLVRSSLGCHSGSSPHESVFPFSEMSNIFLLLIKFSETGITDFIIMHNYILIKNWVSNITKSFYLCAINVYKAPPWRKQLDVRLRAGMRSSRLPCGFRAWWNGVWVGLSSVFSRFPCHKVYSTIYIHVSFISFYFVSSAPAMVFQA